MARELPDQAARKRKMLCGGHSLGGVLTAYFAEWDFDGNPATTGDAGYNQCSGYFALDTRIATGLPGTGGGEVPAEWVPLVKFGAGAVQAGLETGVVPRALSAPAVVNTETMNLLAIAGLAANLDPGGVSDLATYVPSGFNQDMTYRLLFSKDYPTFLKGSPTVKDFRFTNAAALGGLLDDNSEPLAFMQASVGFWDGGKIVDKEFPAPNNLDEIGLGGLARLLGKDKKAIPDEPNGPLFTWRNYDRVGAPDDPVYKSKDGTPFTSAGKEVTDIAELARSLSEHPLDFTEHYFPTKLITDIALASAPGLADGAVHEGGIAANPVLNLEAGDGLGAAARPRGVCFEGRAAGRWTARRGEGWCDVGVRTWIESWPVYRQFTGDDPLGRGAAAKSAGSERIKARVNTADRVVKSVCPYCAVGCGQDVYVTDGKVTQVEGDPDSPVSRGRLCPKGSATLQLTTGSAREHRVLYRRPGGADWEHLDLDTAMDMIADRVIEARRHGWQWEQDGVRVRRTLGVASLGGATLDNEENYLIKKLFTALGAVQIENQARV